MHWTGFCLDDYNTSVTEVMKEITREAAAQQSFSCMLQNAFRKTNKFNHYLFEKHTGFIS